MLFARHPGSSHWCLLCRELCIPISHMFIQPFFQGAHIWFIGCGNKRDWAKSPSEFHGSVKVWIHFFPVLVQHGSNHNTKRLSQLFGRVGFLRIEIYYDYFYNCALRGGLKSTSVLKITYSATVPVFGKSVGFCISATVLWNDNALLEKIVFSMPKYQG